MNKKDLTLLIVIILVAIIGGISFALNMNKVNDTEKNAENKNQTV